MGVFLHWNGGQLTHSNPVLLGWTKIVLPTAPLVCRWYFNSSPMTSHVCWSMGLWWNFIKPQIAGQIYPRFVPGRSLLLRRSRPRAPRPSCCELRGAVLESCAQRLRGPMNLGWSRSANLSRGGLYIGWWTNKKTWSTSSLAVVVYIR